MLRDDLSSIGRACPVVIFFCEIAAIARNQPFCCVVITIDRMLPGINGIAVIRRLRREGIFTRALIVSALGEIDDRVRGLRTSGDDYLVSHLPLWSC
jgi:DNA-binding response OmpR family regulator